MLVMTLDLMKELNSYEQLEDNMEDILNIEC